MRKYKSLSAAFMLPAALILSGSLTGAGLPQSSGTSVQEYLSDNPQITVVDDAVLDSPSALVVGADGETVDVIGGSEPEGTAALSSESVQAAAACSYRSAVFATFDYQNSTNGCSIIGWNSSATWNYSWYQDTYAWNSGASCVQGRGYWSDPTIYTVRWFGAGCGSGGGVTAHIGNRATVALIRGKAIQLPAIGYVRWL